MNQTIYWAGFSVVASEALGIHLGVSSMLARLLKNAGRPVRNGQFTKSWREDRGGGYIKARSAVVFACRLREALRDVGFGEALVSVRSDYGDDSGAYLIERAEAGKIIQWVEGQTAC